MSITRKIASVSIAFTTAVWLSGAAMILPVAQAQSASDLQAQIAALLAQIQQLQSQLNVAKGSPSSSYTFTRDLTLGSKGDDVTALQNVLISGGYLKVAATGYFGSLTKAALVAWQKANGISGTGYFGPKSRAAIAASVPSTPSTPSIPGVVIPSSGISVTLASDTPSGSAIAGAGQVEVAKYNFAAGNSATVTGMTFKKIGVVSDSNLSNLYLADESGAVIAQYSSLNKGVVTFNNLNIALSAGQTKKLVLRVDLSSSATSGQTLGFSLDTVTAGGVTVSGLPLDSKNLSVTSVSNPSIATFSWNFNSAGSSVDAGTNGVVIGTASLAVANSAVWLKSVKFTVVGSATLTDLRNAKLMINGTQVGSTLASIGADGVALFDLSANPVKIGVGNATADLYADVMGSPNRNFTVHVLRTYDLYVVDSEYNTGITPSVTDDSNQVSINTGSITVGKASDTPTGNVAIGASNVTMAKFTIYAAGEPVKIKFLDLAFTRSGGDTWATLANLTEDINNIQLIDDVGGQVGNTISTITEGTTNGTCTLTSATVTTCHLGTSSSPINYIVPANTTRVLSAKVNILSTNDSTSLTASLPGNSSNLEGQISVQSASSGAVTGAVLTVSTTPLSVALNGSFSAPTYVAGTQNAKIASFVLSASSAESVKVNTITVDKDSNANFDIQNLKLMVGSTQFGTTRATVADAETSIAFSGATPIVVPAGGSVTVDVYADILTTTTATTHSATIDYTSLTAIGGTSNSSITAPSAVSGQDVVISSGPTLTVAVDSATPSAQQVVMSTTDNSVFAIRMSANNVEDVKVTDLTFLDTVTGNTAGRTSFKNMKIYDGSVAIAGPKTPTIADTTTSTVTFSFATPVVVSKNGNKTLVLKGDLGTYDEGAISGSGHTWSINATSTDVVAYGKDSNGSATVSFSGTVGGNAMSVYRSKISLTSSLLGAATSRARAAVDDVATVNWTANSAYQVLLGTVAVKFNGLAVSNGSGAFSVSLLKADGSAFGSASATDCTPGAGNSCVVTFYPQFTVSAGATQGMKVRVNSSSFYNAASTGESLSVLINATTDVAWNDGVTAGIGLEASTVPFTIANMSYE